MFRNSRKAVLSAVFILCLTGLFAESSGELVKSLYSPLFLGGGSSVTRMDTPQAASLNPAAAGNFQRTILDGSYINLQEWDGGLANMGHFVNTAVSYPGKYGVFTGALRFASLNSLDKTFLNLGTFGSLNASFSKEIYKNLYAGFGLSGAYGTEDWGAALNLGFLHRPGSYKGLKNFRWGGSFTGLGREYGSAGSYLEAVPENLSLNLGAGFDFMEKKGLLWSMTGDLGFPALSDLRLSVGQEVLIQERLKIALSSSMILTDLIDGDYRTLIPSAGIYYNYSFKGKGGEKTEKQTSEIEIQGAYAPFYDNVTAIGAGVTIPFGVRDANPPRITLEEEELLYISPDLNGVQDEIDVPFKVVDERLVMGYYLAVRNEDGDIVKEFRNKDERPENESFQNIFARMFSEKKGTSIPASFRWDGVMDSGENAPDGNYSYTLRFWDDNDNIAETRAYPFVIDTVRPSVDLAKPEGIDLIFSPDGDGNKDTLSIRQEGSEEALWEGEILNLAGDVVRRYRWEEAAPAAFEWDGKNELGQIVPDGVYSYAVRSTDPAGNFREDSLVDILINTEKPPVGLTIDNAFLSPGNREGADTIRFATGIPVTAGILEWELQVLDSRGAAAWEYNSRQEGVLEVPETLAYQGEDAQGGFLSEGRYQGYLTVRYQNGYEPEAFSPWFTVDTTAPRAAISGSSLLTLNDEGTQYSLSLNLSSSEEEYWEGFIRNEANEVVKSFFWRGQADPVVRWEGSDNQGKLVPDGSYYMVLETVDKAGNRGVSSPHRIRLDTREMSAQISAGQEAFSPNGDGVKDRVPLYTVVEDADEITQWSVAVRPAGEEGPSGPAVKTWSGAASPAEELSWDGSTDAGGPAPDGLYLAEITAVYAKGNKPQARSARFRKDTVVPEIRIAAAETLFSPDGDGYKDSLLISQSSSVESAFEGVLEDSAGNPVKSWLWEERAEDLLWDGTDDNGNPLPDGSYAYSVSSTDDAGNSVRKTLGSIRIDTKATPVYLTAKNTLFSPVSEELPEQVFTAHVTNPEGIDGWSLRILNGSGEAVRTFRGEGGVPATLNWDGRNEENRLAEGVFTGALEVIYAKGNRPAAESREFTLDNSAPQVQVDPTPQPFSPDDDNVEDELKIAIAVKDLSPIREWQMVIRDPKGKEFISFGGKGRPSERIIWDGRSRQGELVQSAEDYPYELRVTDLLGNSTLVEGEIPVDILVIRDGENLKVMISNITFAPYRADLVSSGEKGDKNREILKRLAEVLKKYGSYGIVVEGHAVSEYFDNPARAAREEREELQPLSLKRAAEVRSALGGLGIQESRMDVVGRGGTAPIVPHSDLDNRWKNRRVEFILIK